MTDSKNIPNSQTHTTVSQNVISLANTRNQILVEFESEMKLYLKKYSDDMAKCDLGNFISVV